MIPSVDLFSQRRYTQELCKALFLERPMSFLMHTGAWVTVYRQKLPSRFA